MGQYKLPKLSKELPVSLTPVRWDKTVTFRVYIANLARRLVKHVRGITTTV